MPSQKKLRPRRALVSPDTENIALDSGPLPLPRCCHPDKPPLNGGNGHNRHHAFSSNEKISNLVQLNDTLVKQVSSMRSEHCETTAKIKLLEELLQSSRSNTNALLQQGKSLELELATRQNDLAGLQVQNTALLAEKDELEDALSDLSVRQQELKEQLEAERKASASSKSELCSLIHDVELLRMDNEKLVDHNKKLSDENEEVIEECTGLKSEKTEIRSKLKLLHSREATLEEKLANMSKLYGEEQLKAINANELIEVLQAEASRGKEAIVRLEGQLIEASQRIAFLETQHVAAINCQSLLDLQVKGLENDLATERDAHEKAASSLEQERRDKEVGILAVACEIDKLRVDKEKLIDESIGFKSIIAAMQVDVKHRQAKEVRLEEELLHERNAHASAQLEITSANVSIKAFRDAATSRDEAISKLAAAQLEIANANESINVLHGAVASRDEAISKLERQLSEASQRIVVFETRCAEATERQTELEMQIARLESDLSGTRTELLNASSNLEQERDAKEDEICSLNCKVEHLRLDKEKLIEKNSALSAKNTGFQSSMKQLQSKEATLGKELSRLRGSYSSAQTKVNDMNKTIKTMESEASRRNADIAKFEEQLKAFSQHVACLESQSIASTETQTKLESQICALQNDLLEQEMQAKESLDSKQKEVSNLGEQMEEASQQMAELESQIAASMERQTELETLIKALEKDLLASRNAHLSASSALEKEKQARSSLESLLDASQAKSRSLVEHLESVKSCLLGRDYTSNTDLESFQSLQSQLFCLVDEKKALEEAKIALEKKVSLLNARSTQTSLKAKLESDKLSEQLRQLELALSDVKDEVLRRDNTLTRVESDLRRAKNFLEEKSKQVRLALPMAVASTSALIFVGLLSYLRGMEN